MKLIKSVAIIMGAGAMALVGGFVVGVTTNLIKQARAAKAEHKLRMFVVEPFAKMAILFEECAKGHATLADVENQHRVATDRVSTLPKGCLQVNLLAELHRLRGQITELEEAASAQYTSATQEELTHA